MIGGNLYAVPNVTVIGPHETKWSHLNAGDGVPRTMWPCQYMLHKTIADDPEHILAGAGKAGGAEQTAEMWDEDPHHSGAHLITGFDGVTACLEDLALFEAWHGNQANQRAVGHEIKEVVGGGVYQATLDAALSVTLTATRILGIQWQCPASYKDNHTLSRYADGGRTLYGIFGHRDVSDARNRWDPGDIIFAMLRAHGVEAFDFVAGQDRDVWSKRQDWLKSLGHDVGPSDGLPGHETTKALLAIGYPDGIFALGAALDLPRPPA